MNTTCPNCESDEIEGGNVEIENDRAIQKVWCLVCEATWNDIYKHIGRELT